jgi:hypothetical protein
VAVLCIWPHALLSMLFDSFSSTHSAESPVLHSTVAPEYGLNAIADLPTPTVHNREGAGSDVTNRAAGGSPTRPRKKYSTKEIPVELVNLETGQFLVRYISTTEAARAHGMSRGSLRDCIIAQRLCKDLFFREQGSDVMPGAKKPYRARGCKIEKLNFQTGAVIAEYDSVKEAAAANGTSNFNINSCLSGRIKSSQGFRWRCKVEP